MNCNTCPFRNLRKMGLKESKARTQVNRRQCVGGWRLYEHPSGQSALPYDTVLRRPQLFSRLLGLSGIIRLLHDVQQTFRYRLRQHIGVQLAQTCFEILLRLVPSLSVGVGAWNRASFLPSSGLFRNFFHLSYTPIRMSLAARPFLGSFINLAMKPIRMGWTIILNRKFHTI